MPRTTELELRNRDAGRSLRIEYAEPPADMPPAAKKLWRPMVDLMGRSGLLVSLDLFALERLCLAYADYVEATEELDRNVIPIYNKSDKITEYRRSKYYQIVDKEGNRIWKRHPAAEDAQEADKRMLAWLKEFGLTPSSRKTWLRPALNNPVDELPVSGGASGFEHMDAEDRGTLRAMLEKQALRQSQEMMHRADDVEDAEVVEK